MATNNRIRIRRTKSRSCTSKIRHPTSLKAQIAGGAAEIRYGEAMHVYQCPWCCGWHVGHRPAWYDPDPVEVTTQEATP